MTAVTPQPPRIAALDTVRGVAVMGILAMNAVAFAMPYPAYTNPEAWGGASGADLVSWMVSFVFVEGKMRGLFSFLFGASMLLVIERSEAAGGSSETVHFRRMAWLLVFGLAHFYFVWWGDILSLYAPAGMIAWFFWTKSARSLVAWGALLVIAQFILFAGLAVSYLEAAAAAAAPGASPAAMEAWKALKSDYAPGTPKIAEEIAIYSGDYAAILRHRLTEQAWEPLNGFLFYGPETVGYMLLGMAALKTGFLTGAWSDAAYRRAAGWGLAVTVPASATMAFAIWRSGFDIALLLALTFAGSIPLRPLMVAAYAALIILLCRRGGWLTHRIAAAGRTAFTNYLGTSLVMTTLFYGYGFGLFGRVGRAELWVAVAGLWTLMLLWSKPWLEWYRYGPFEWLWRSLARGARQPMRR